MWVFLNDAFFSIVDFRAKRAGKRRPLTQAKDSDMLVVRARVEGDIQRVFADFNPRVTASQASDYRFRAVIPRQVVKRVMAAEVDRITYGNFKDSVEEHERHRAYSGVWGVMYRLQEPDTKQPLSKVNSLF